MILNNLLFRASQYRRDNREKLIKWGMISLGLIILFLLIFGGIESWNARQFEKKVSAIEAKERAASAKASRLESEADALKSELSEKRSELQFITARANAAEIALRNAKAKTITLKEEYETIRYLPVPADVSCAELRAELAGLGFK